MRGAPGSGKSTWIEKNGLKLYALSPDDIRLMCQSPLLLADAVECISQENEKMVWKIFLELLETRMRYGELTVVDATCSNAFEIKRYRELCHAYKYRIYCVDFTGVPVGEVKRRNGEREKYKRVPDIYIDILYTRFQTQKVPSGIPVIRPDELEQVWIMKKDFSQYKKIHHIGDIHGCYTVLQKYISDNGGIKEDELYIFLGDYIDRGTENAEVIRFLIPIMNRKNVLLEGNHEKNLWRWANDLAADSKEFERITMPQLEKIGNR